MQNKTESHKVQNYRRIVYFGLLGLFIIIILVAFSNNNWNAFAQKQNSNESQNIKPNKELTNNDETQNFTQEKNIVNYDEVLRKASEKGYVSIIIGFNFNFTPEGYLTDSSRENQHAKIIDNQNRILNKIKSFEPRNIKQFDSIPYLALTVDARGLEVIKNLPEINYIIEDGFFELNLSQSREVVRAPQAWQLGYSGQGQVVAVLDTGIDKNHTFLNGKVISEACYSNADNLLGYTSLCPNGVSSSTNTNSGLNCNFAGCDHGTHVAGTAAGKEIVLNGVPISGIAKDAHLVSIQVFSYDNSKSKITSQFSDVIRGLIRVRDLKNSGVNIASVNMSLGTPDVYTVPNRCDADYQAIKVPIDNLQSLGVATIISSGNGDPNTGYGYINGISAPACISSAVSVGSTGLYSTTDDNISLFSNSASFLDLVAPGYNIYSSVPGNFEEKPGTSMAAPHVAGAWAILKQRNPNASVADILISLFTTGQAINDQRNTNTNITKPRIRVDHALQSLVNGGCSSISFNFGQSLTNQALSADDCVFQGTKFYDVYRFSGIIGRQVAVDMNSSFDTYLYLVDPNGNVVGENDDIDTSNRNSRISITLPLSGTYSIWATSYNVNQIGNYTISLTGNVGCTYTIPPPNLSFPSSGGNGSTNIATQTGCSWTTTSNVNWITITSGASVTGSGPMGFTVAPNTTTSSREGKITIPEANQTFKITQSPLACDIQINPTVQNFSSSGGTGSINVSVNSGCPWVVTSSASWLTITSNPNGNGNGTINYTVSANTGVARNSTINIGGRIFTIMQDAIPTVCDYQLNQTIQVFSSGSGTGSVNVIANAGCAWSATSNDNWITITSGSSGSGSGLVNYSVQANSSAARSGTMTIAGKAFTVNQSAATVVSNGIPGNLDLSFGVDGTLQIDFGNKAFDSAQAVAVQSDGKIVSVGFSDTPTSGRDFAVSRVNSDGTLDTAFNGSGRFTFNFNSANREDTAKAVAIQPDGKIVVAGHADVLGFGNFDIVLARLNSDGSFDTSFGTNGKVITNLDNRADYARSLAIQSDGKIVVSGYSNRATTGEDFVVVRYNSNGSLDTSFNGNGIVITDILTNRADRANAVVLQLDGKIVAAGYTNDPSFKNNFVVVRYNSNGSLDSGFNGTGKVTTDLNVNSDDFGNAVSLQTDGKIVVAGHSSFDFGMVRYNSNGSLDTTFGGGDGIVTTNSGGNAPDIGRGVGIQNDGKIIIAGRINWELAFARYNFDGALDTTFGRGGFLVQNSGNHHRSPDAGYWGIALQNDGKIVAVGDGWRDFSGNDFAISRVNSNGKFDSDFNGGDGITSTDIFGNNDEITDAAVQTDGKLVVTGYARTSTGNNDVVVARYNINGTLDNSFGNSGIITTDIQGHPEDSGQAIAVQSDGKIVIAGHTNNANDGNLKDGFLARYNTNGTLDLTFGTGGIVITEGSKVNSTALTWLYPRDLQIQPDGKIVVAGQAKYVSVHSEGFVARYNTNGTLDNSFLTNIPNQTLNGSATVNFGNNFVYSHIDAVALQSDGKIVVAGFTNSTSNGGPGTDLAIARLNPNGSLDTSFDGDGKLTTDFGNNSFDAATDVEIQPDGKIIAVGYTHINFIDMAVARYNPNGSLDTTFGGGDGKLNLDFNAWGDVCTAVALQPDGKIVLGGGADLERNFSGFAVARLTSTGQLDTSFGNGTGRVITNLGDGLNTALSQGINDMVLQSDGKIVLAGTSNFNSTNQDLTIVRYENNSFPNRTQFDFDGDGKTDYAIFRSSAGEWWYLRSGDGGNRAFQFGLPLDKIVPADYTGDGKTDVAFFRPSTNEWFVLRSEDSSFYSAPFGAAGDIPVPADFDGDGKADLAVFRPSEANWYINRSSGGFSILQFGANGDIPVPADYDGDGKADLAIFRPSKGEWWFLRSSDGGNRAFQFGNSTDKPVPADYTGDGKTDVAFYRPATSGWFVLRSEDGSFYSAPFGAAGDVPVPGDYDGDGKADIAVWRASDTNWYVVKSSGGFSIAGFGSAGDKPVPSAFVP